MVCRAPATSPAGAYDVQESSFTLVRSGEWAEVVDDEATPDGKAARMPGGRTQWAVPVHADHHPDLLGKGRWRAYVVVRVEPKRSSGVAFRYGAFDTRRHVNIAGGDARLEIAGDGAYHADGMLINELKPGMYFWVSPTGDAAVDAIYVDRLYLMPAADDRPSVKQQESR